MKSKILALAALVCIALSSCTTGSDSTSGDDSSGKGVGVPKVVQPLEVRDLVHDTMRGKRIAFVPILYKGFKLTEQWGSDMERAFDMLGADFKVYDSNFDTDQMVRTINDLIAKKAVDVLILHNPDLGVLTKQIQDAQAAGIYTVVINMISNQSGDAFVGDDVVSSAEDIAERAVADCKKKGKSKVAIIDGVGPDAYSLQFNAGAKKVLKDAGFEVVAQLQSQWQADKANQQATTILQRHRDEICAILLPWDVVAIAAGEAVSAAEKQGLIANGSVGVYSQDGSADWCKALKEGKVTASSVYQVMGVGTATVAAVQQLLEVGDPPGTRRTVAYVPHVVVDKSNVDKVSSACYQGS